jgi:hypothetical protein
MMRIGCGAGFSSDRLEPAVDLARRGELDVILFETIGERTMAFGHRDRKLDPARGYNPQLAARMRGVLKPCRDHGTRIVTNMGVANVAAAADVTLSIAREQGLRGLKVAAVEGDDVTHLIGPDTVLVDNEGKTVREVGLPVVGANAYLGIDALLPALSEGADVVIAGRVSDPSLALAPLVHYFGWKVGDWAKLGRGVLVGHLLECGMQVTGGYFADPGFKDVSRLADCGFPIAEVDGDGAVTITKLEGTGGLVDQRTVKEQLVYEVHDPSAYLTPDVTADFSGVRVTETGRDRVHLEGASGRERPRTLKVTVGFDGGFLGEAGISYAGPNAARRARLARDILLERLQRHPGLAGKLRIDIIGLASLHATALGYTQAAGIEAEDVRVHAAARSTARADVETLLWEVESLLCCGPAGGGGYRGQISPSVVTHSALIERSEVAATHRILVA